MMSAGESAIHIYAAPPARAIPGILASKKFTKATSSGVKVLVEMPSHPG